MTNAVKPKQFSTAERLNEIAGILAAGLMRLRAGQSTCLSRYAGKTELDFTALASGHCANFRIRGG